MGVNSKTIGEPVYISIFTNLKDQIMQGGLNPGDLLPSENLLATRFQTSRETVRKSLSRLENDGLIYSRPGKGYYVSSPQHHVFSMSFSEDDTQHQSKYRSITVIEPTREIREALDLAEDKKVIEINRVITKDGQPIAYDIKYLPYDKGAPILEAEINYAVFPDIVAAKTAPFSFCTQMEISAEFGTEEINQTLHCEKAEPLLVVYRYFIGQDGAKIGYGKKYLKQAYGKLKASSGYFSL